MSKLPHKLFMIKSPYLSKNMAKIYHKQIQVFEIKKTTDDIDNMMFSVSKILEFKKNQWEEIRFIPEDFLIRGAENGIVQELSNNGMGSVVKSFRTFEEAYISKVMMVRNLREVYENNIRLIEGYRDRNLPCMDDHLKLISEEYPEHLI